MSFSFSIILTFSSLKKQEEKVFYFTYKLVSITTSWKCLPPKRRNFYSFLQPYDVAGKPAL